MNDPTTDFWSLNHIWLTLITVLGAIVTFFTRRVIEEVDHKANKDELDELKADFKAMLISQTAQHNANTVRLDQILLELTRK